MDNTIPKNIEAQEKALSDVFYLMYGHFPESAMLVHKSKRIVALNAGARALGREAGQFCVKLGPAAMHAGCLAHKALNEQRAMYKAVKFQEKNLIVYWLPIDGYPDYYIHFSVGNRDYCL